MSTVSAPFGFRPAWHPTGLSRSRMQVNGIASTYAANLYRGTPIKLATAGVLQIGSTAEDILGVFDGVEYSTSDGRRVTQSFWPTGQAYSSANLNEPMYVYYWDDPDIVYEVQADGAIAATAIGDQADGSNLTAGSTYTGQSQATLSSTLVGAGNQGQWRIINLAPLPNNAWGDAYTVVWVQLARSQFVSNKVAI